jgi:hypothetical protein
MIIFEEALEAMLERVVRKVMRAARGSSIGRTEGPWLDAFEQQTMQRSLLEPQSQDLDATELAPTRLSL